MFEPSHEHEDRYTQQGRRSQSPFNDRRSYSRGQDDRLEDRYRYRAPDSERRYTRPDYDSELDIERPGQAHFGSRGGSDYEGGWQRPYRSQGNEGSRTSYDFSRGGVDYGSYGRGGMDYGSYGRGGVDYGSYGRGMSDWGRGLGDYGHQGYQGRGYSDYGRDYSTGSGMGHADWNRFGSDDENQNQGWGRRSYEQPSWNEQRNRWPKSYKRSDERIKDDIHEELIRHGRIDASDVEVQVKDGEVTLTGQVSSRQDKRVAEELAEKVLGVHDVQNQLRVRNLQSSSSSSPNLPGSNRMSVAGQQQQDPNKSAVNSTSK